MQSGHHEPDGESGQPKVEVAAELLGDLGAGGERDHRDGEHVVEDGGDEVDEPQAAGACPVAVGGQRIAKQHGHESGAAGHEGVLGDGECHLDRCQAGDMIRRRCRARVTGPPRVAGPGEAEDDGRLHPGELEGRRPDPQTGLDDCPKAIIRTSAEIVETSPALSGCRVVVAIAAVTATMTASVTISPTRLSRRGSVSPVTTLRPAHSTSPVTHCRCPLTGSVPLWRMVIRLQSHSVLRI